MNAKTEVKKIIQTIEAAAKRQNFQFKEGETDKTVYFEFENRESAEKIYNKLPNNFRLELNDCEISINIRDLTGY